MPLGDLNLSDTISRNVTLIALAGLIIAQRAPAQTPAPADDEIIAPSPATVIVTARKRDEPLAKVPESLTVFPSGSLEALDIQSFNDYAALTPNLSYSYGSGTTAISAARTISIRGITGQSLFGTSGATGFYIDDTPVPESVDPRILDIQRVEILKGPQGTLYGESSLGGNVRIITKRPDLTHDDLGYMAQLGVTSGGGSADGGAGVIGNVVLVPERSAVRVVLFGNHDAGYLTRTFPSPTSPAVSDPSIAAPRTSVADQGAQTTYGGSVTALVHVSEALDVRLRLMAQNTHDKGFPAAFAPLPAFEPAYRLDRAYDIQPGATDAWALPSLDIHYRGPGFTVVSSTSYFYRHNRDIEDSTYGTEQIMRGYYGVTSLPPQPFLWDQEHHENQWTEELHLTSDPIHGVRGTVGTFLASTRSTLSVVPEHAQGLQAATVDNTVVGPWPNDLLWTDYNPGVQDDASVFGELSWAFARKLTATLGARQYWLRQRTDFTADGFNNFGVTPSDPQTSRQSGVNPKVGLSYQVTDGMMVYASASQGFRAGAAQPYLPFCALPTLPVEDITHVKSDSLWSYELGAKIEVPGTGLLLSAAAFHIDWRNLQQQVALPCGAYFIINGGRARIDGGELELDGHVVPSLQLRAGVGYERADISDPGPLAIVGVEPGSRILGVPAWTASVAGIFTHPISSRLEGFIEADVSYTGDSLALLNGGNGLFATRPSYVLADMRMGVRRGLSELSLNLRNVSSAKPNLGDLGYVGYAQYTSAGTIIPQVATLPPFTALLEYRHNF